MKASHKTDRPHRKEGKDEEKRKIEECIAIDPRGGVIQTLRVFTGGGGNVNHYFVLLQVLSDATAIQIMYILL